MAGRREDRHPPADRGHPLRLPARRRDRPGREARAGAPELKADGAQPEDLRPARRPAVERPRGRADGSGRATPARPASGSTRTACPVRGEGDFRPGETAHFARTRVQLRKGENRLYAMASQARLGRRPVRRGRPPLRRARALGPAPHPGPGDQRLREPGPEVRPRRRPSGSPTSSGSQGVQGGRPARRADRPGRRPRSTADRIDDAFRRLRERRQGAARGHRGPLPGRPHRHRRRRRTSSACSCPSSRSEDAAPPLADVAARGPGVAIRGRRRAARLGARVGDPNVLPYAVLYNRLARLEALQRLVIVDACQAGAILDDRAVARIQKNVERGSRKARNSYLLAARRGEPANEVDALQHGLLTYTLLRGMGAGGLKPIPDGPRRLPRPPLGRPRRRRPGHLRRAGRLRRRRPPPARPDVPPGRPRGPAGRSADPGPAEPSPELEQRAPAPVRRASFPRWSSTS